MANDVARGSGIPLVDAKTPGDVFENAIRTLGVLAACEWFGHAPDSEFTRESIRILQLRSGLPPPTAPPRKPAHLMVEPADKDDLWAMWPDDYMCPVCEIESWMRPPCARSDDYAIVRVMAYGGDGTPSHWEPHVRPAATPRSV